MLSKYFIGINWADFLIIGLIARMCFIGWKTGVAIELFKLLSLYFATLVAFHVYTAPVSDMLNARLPALPLLASDVFVFVFLVALVTIIGRIIRESFFLLIKIETHNTLDRWGGLCIGCLRGFWIASIVLFVMTISTIQYLETSAKTSLFGHKILYMAPTIYRANYEALVSKLLPRSKINEEVFRSVER
ncbi:MAG: CvpA family protein [Candidatus Omnitrophota bacterium]